ncbi:MAG: hypothetical protein Q7T29_16285 [Gallionella sp.]|nr:hypothetical protein [Gallionella sp.]
MKDFERTHGHGTALSSCAHNSAATAKWKIMTVSRSCAFIFAGFCGYPESGKTALLDWRQITFIGPLWAFKILI